MNKAYLVDVGHRNILLGKMNETLLEESEIGLVIQTIAFNHSTRLKFLLSKYSDYEVYYWEDGEGEIDVVLDLPIFVLPMEVKCNSAQKSLKAVYKFIAEHKKSKWGIIICKDELKVENNVLFLPLWAFLLMC